MPCPITKADAACRVPTSPNVSKKDDSQDDEPKVDVKSSRIKTENGKPAYPLRRFAPRLPNLEGQRKRGAGSGEREADERMSE